MKFIKKFFLFYDLLRKRRIGSYLQDTTNLLNKSGNKNFIALNFSFLYIENCVYTKSLNNPHSIIILTFSLQDFHFLQSRKITFYSTLTHRQSLRHLLGGDCR